jgi:hypothetical protein
MDVKHVPPGFAPIRGACSRKIPWHLAGSERLSTASHRRTYALGGLPAQRDGAVGKGVSDELMGAGRGYGADGEWIYAVCGWI